MTFKLNFFPDWESGNVCFDCERENQKAAEVLKNVDREFVFFQAL